MRVLLLFVIYFRCGLCNLWPKGVVHFAINKKDYDPHSQDVIMSTFAKIQTEICVKFFNTPTNYTATDQDKILYISNPDKRKDCPPDHYDFSGSVVDMPIGYRCINERDISRIAVGMLRSSIAQTVTSFNSFDLIQKFQQRDEESQSSLLSAADRNHINAHYHSACGELNEPVGPMIVRRAGEDDVKMSVDNEKFYGKRRWPLGIVMYGVDPAIPSTDEELSILHQAMTAIEMATCIVFQRMTDTEMLEPKNFLWFTNAAGEEFPHLGFLEGRQMLKLSAITTGVPGHTAHVINMLLRIVGIPMMSNRFDRDNYVTIDWKNVEYGKEHYLEKMPTSGWLKHLPYDFSSASHAPANYVCRDCKSPAAAHTVIPVQDILWQKTLSMGHRRDLSDYDIQTVNFVYERYCQQRAMAYKFS